MTIYWLLLAFPAVMASIHPARLQRGWLSSTQLLAMMSFILFSTAISLVRHEIGADWNAYLEMYEQARGATLDGSLTLTDPLFGLVLWISARLGTGIYLVDGICSLILVCGVVRAAAQTREPWLAILVAVPYLLIVVGMGYVRQAAAIGMILLAIVALSEDKPLKTAFLLVGAVGFHSTAAVVLPFFVLGLANRNRLRLLGIVTAGVIGFITLLADRLSDFQAGYIETEYDSSGALVRLLMGLLPAVLLLARHKLFTPPERVRMVWIGFALANVVGLAALMLSPSSTAVDRIMLYFSPVQIIVFGEMAALLGFSQRSGLLVRLVALAYAVGVQLVWMLFASHADNWVPYRSLLDYL